MNITQLSRTNKPILILGETGVGKTALAKKIHKLSARNYFNQLNINSLSSSLFESEMFGHLKGSFSGAITDKKGFCEITGSGTLFLDEIGDLSLELQVKLLTLIDESKYFPVGSCTQKTFYGRLIFATNKDLAKMVEKGTFRKDLYFRLRYFELDLPPLRSSKNLLEEIMNKVMDVRVALNTQNIILSPNVIDLLTNYKWPGNYRELENTIEYLYLLGKSKISCEDLPNWINTPNANMKTQDEDLYYDALALFERSYFKRILRKYEGRVNITAQNIGLSKVTLISKLKKYDIDRREFKNLNIVEEAHGF